ncbi:hypothetical protein HKD37_06G015256 [Glycine soja]
MGSVFFLSFFYFRKNYTTKKETSMCFRDGKLGYPISAFRAKMGWAAFQTSKPPSTPKHKRSEPTPNPNSTPERRVQLTFNDDDEGGKENLRHHVGKRVEGGKKRCVSCRRETSRRRESCGSQEGVFAEGRVLRGRGSSWRQSSWERREFGKGCKGSLVN